MTRCDRFEREGLLRLEQGLPLDDHFETCPDCRKARATYERLRQEIAAAGSHREPPAHWQARVWAAIEEGRRRRRRSWWPWLLVPVAAALISVVVFLPQSPPGLEARALEVEVQRGGAVVLRGEGAQPGDRLLLRAHTGALPNAELRVYRQDTELVLRCSTEPPCVRQGDELRASLVLDSVGAYQPLLLLSSQPLPEPISGLDRDAGAALAAGARVHLGDELEVR